MPTTKRQTAIRFDAETEQMIATLAERQRSTATRVIIDAVRHYYQDEMARMPSTTPSASRSND